MTVSTVISFPFGAVRFVTDFDAGDDMLHQHVPHQNKGKISLLWIMKEKAFRRAFTAQGGILMLLLICACEKILYNEFASVI